MLAHLENISVHMLEEAWPHQDLIQVSFITLRGYYGSYLVKDEEDGRWRLSLLISRYSFSCCFFCCLAWWFFLCWCAITLIRTPQVNVNQWEILDSESRRLGRLLNPLTFLLGNAACRKAGNNARHFVRPDSGPQLWGHLGVGFFGPRDSALLMVFKLLR